MKNFRIEAAILAVGLAILGIFIYNGIHSLATRDRIVSVRGLAEKEVKADRVIWPLVYKSVGNDMAEVYSDINNANTKITNFLVQNGVSKDEISVGAAQVEDLWTNQYNTNKPMNRYNVTSTITVTSKNVDLIRGLISRTGELLKQGIAIGGGDYNTSIQYDFTSLNKIKPKMIEEATKNAREAANKFAKDSESEIGKIKSATQGLFEITDRDQNTPYIKEVRVVTTVDYYLDN